MERAEKQRHEENMRWETTSSTPLPREGDGQAGRPVCRPEALTKLLDLTASLSEIKRVREHVNRASGKIMRKIRSVESSAAQIKRFPHQGSRKENGQVEGRIHRLVKG